VRREEGVATEYGFGGEIAIGIVGAGGASDNSVDFGSSIDHI
jgi:hypothetical protein